MNSTSLNHTSKPLVFKVLAATVVAFAIVLSVTPIASSQLPTYYIYDYLVENDAEGWEVGFADLPVDYDQSIYELDHAHGPLPEGLEGNGIYVQGHNRSDDLFMFLKRQIDGLEPNTTYSVGGSLKLATNVPAGSIGIGGSPGESVFVKMGVSTIEPNTLVDDTGHLRMNIDKGNQANRGANMIVVGDIANAEVVSDEYRIKWLHIRDQDLTATTDGEGKLWLIVGTDSGFEGFTAIYYDLIGFNFGRAETPTAPESPRTGGTEFPVWVVLLLALLGLTLTSLRWSRKILSLLS